MNSNINKLHRNIRLDYLFTFINNLNMSSSIWVLYLAYRGMNLLEIGLLEGLFHITSTICEVPSGAIADLWGRKNTLIGGRIYIAISCIIMLFAGIISCLGAISSEKLSKLFKTHITKISAAMIALSILLFSLGKLSPAVLGLFVSSYFNSLLYPIQSTSLNQRIPSEQRATLISVNSMVFSLFMIAMFPAAGAFADC